MRTYANFRGVIQILENDTDYLTRIIDIPFLSVIFFLFLSIIDAIQFKYFKIGIS